MVRRRARGVLRSTIVSAALIAAATLAQPTHAGAAVATPDSADRRWSDHFALPNFDQPVRATLEFEGALIVAGEFTQVGGDTVSHVARWNGSGWEQIGPDLVGKVYALANDHGTLVAGGDFFLPEGFDRGLARWDGARWVALDPAVTFRGRVSAIAVSDSDVVVGGTGIVAGNTFLGNIARWDGHGWSPLGDGLDIYAYVNALAYFHGTLIAGGSHDPSSPDTVGPLAAWDGARWAQYAGGVFSSFQAPVVSALVVHRGALFVGGVFDSIPGHRVASFARFDGVAWDSIPGSLSASVVSLAAVGDSLLAGGVFFDPFIGPMPLAVWDGAALHPVPMAELLEATAVGTDAGVPVVFGRLADPSSPPCAGYRWDGGSWHALEAWRANMHGLTGPVYAFAVYQGRLYAGGAFRFAGDPPRLAGIHGVAMWDGTRWTPVGSTLYWNVQCLTVHQGLLVAGGSFYDPLTVPPIGNVAIWNGHEWKGLGAGTNGQVEALLSVGSDLYAGGWFDRVDGLPANHIARWDGAEWVPLGEGLRNPGSYTFVNALASYGTDLCVTGNFTVAGSRLARNAARWDGTAWSPLGAGLDYTGSALATYQGDLYAGGAFQSAGDSTARGIARWDGTTWHPLRLETGQVSALAVGGDRLFAGGAVMAAPNSSPPPYYREIRNVAAWDGANWQPLGSGVDDRVYALLATGDSLLVGGQFASAGGRSSFRIASWNFAPPPSPLRSLPGPLAFAGSNPFHEAADIRYEIARQGAVRLEVFDLQGHRVTTLVDRAQDPGTYVVRWSPRGGTARGTPPGVYFVRFEAAGIPATSRKLVFMP